MQHRGCEAGLKHRGWVCAFWLVLFGRSFRGSFFGFVLSVVLFVVRAFGRSLGSCFWSFFSWFVLWVRAFGGSYVFLFDALKVLEACVARSEVS